MERDGHCDIGCVGCHQPIGDLSIDSTGRAHVVSLYRQHPDIELESVWGRERVALPCPLCKVTRVSLSTAVGPGRILVIVATRRLLMFAIVLVD
jgi:hypothetical protein